jgi:hypothetical protein
MLTKFEGGRRAWRIGNDFAVPFVALKQPV